MTSHERRPEHLKGQRHLDPERIVRTTVDDVEAAVSGWDRFPAEMEQASTELYQEVLERLRTSLADLKQLVAFVEHHAGVAPAALCAVCQSRFYPSRSDARYCSAKCRMQAHRQAAVDTAAPPKSADDEAEGA